MSKRMLVGLLGANIGQSLAPALHEDAAAAAGMTGDPLRSPAAARALVQALRAPDRRSETTNLVAADADGNVCAVTTSLGLGSGVWVPDFGVHLNSMLGEGELVRDGVAPGMRMGSMMSPMPCTPCTNPITGLSVGHPAVTTTGASPKRRSVAPRLTLDTTVLPVTVGDRTSGSNCFTPQRSMGAGTDANAALSARIAGWAARRRRWYSSAAMRRALSPVSTSG